MASLLDREERPIDWLSDVDTRTTPPSDTNVLQFSAALGKWVPVTGPGGGSGELNTASNIGSSGVAVYDSKVGVDLKFRAIDVGSSKLTVSHNAVNGTVELDLSPIAADELSDIDTTTTAPAVGDVLAWDGSNWIPTDVSEMPQYIKQVDFDDSNNYIYTGEALPGTATSAASWRITRVEFVGSDEDVVKLYADGDANFDNIWDNRGVLAYS